MRMRSVTIPWEEGMQQNEKGASYCIVVRSTEQPSSHTDPSEKQQTQRHQVSPQPEKLGNSQPLYTDLRPKIPSAK